MLDRGILEGIVDMHVHAGPSSVKRSFDAYEMLEEAKAAGYKAFVIKDHYIPSILGATMLTNHFGGGTQALGGVVLNNSVGGINVKVVDACYNMGSKMVWMPTVSAHWEITTRVGKFVGESGMHEEPIYYLTEDGKLNEAVQKLLQYISEQRILCFPPDIAALQKAPN
jgi:hypothetical protein